MDVRALLASSLFLIAGLALAPGASAAPCASASEVDCDASVGNCDLHVGADVITTTAAGASADCRGGSMTRCHAEVGVGQDLLDPTVEHWCAF